MESLCAADFLHTYVLLSICVCVCRWAWVLRCWTALCAIGERLCVLLTACAPTCCCLRVHLGTAASRRKASRDFRPLRASLRTYTTPS
jgi:hypothetical protein